MIAWLVWGLILIVQNAAFTWVSRARNSGSIVYHTIASVFSNGVWSVSLFFVINKFSEAKSIPEKAAVVSFYVLFTTTGATLMHYVSMRWLEKGKRKVGAS